MNMMRQQGKLILLLIATLVLLCFGLLAWKSALAYVYHFQASKTVQGWERYVDLPPLDDIKQVEKKLLRAIELDGGNATYHNELGRVYHYAMNSFGASAERTTYYNKAFASFRSATVLRPSWPHPWANLLLLKAIKGEHDSEFNTLLEMVLKFGPYEKSTESILLHVGLAYWETMPDSYRSWFYQNPKRFLSKENRELFASYQKRHLICDTLDDAKRYGWFCN